MPECLLVIAGELINIDEMLEGCNLTPCRIWRQGEKRSPRSKHIMSSSGLKFTVSEVDDIRVQIRDAINFLEQHRAVLQTLVGAAGVDMAVLDFGWSFDYERSPAQWRTFPIELLHACTAIGLGIEVSVYASSPALVSVDPVE